jgi:hypothetical protein
MTNIRRLLFGAGILAIVSGVSPTVEAVGKAPLYARAEKSTPVLNTENFSSVLGGSDGKTLKKDPGGLIREVEFIALPGTVFEIEDSIKQAGNLIYKVRTSEYLSPAGGLYVDSRFVEVLPDPLKGRVKRLTPKQAILDRMLKNRGLPYVWGANDSSGIPDLMRFYPPKGTISLKDRELWVLKGLDCSGLLYEATNGATPRNTSDLISYGKPVSIEGLTVQEIAHRLEPLDLIVWKGHVIIVLDKTRTIESCLNCSSRGGVTVRDLKAALLEVMKTRTPVNRYPRIASDAEKSFVVRRWYP